MHQAKSVWGSLVIIGAIAALAIIGGMSHETYAATTGSVQVTGVVSGGSAKAQQFSLQIKRKDSTSNANVRASGSVVTFGRLTPGTYTISKVSGPAGYGVSWSGDCNSNGEVIIVADVTAKCTITHVFGSQGGGGGGGGGTTRPRDTAPRSR